MYDYKVWIFKGSCQDAYGNLIVPETTKKTRAVSKGQAKNNIAFQIKKDCNLLPNTKINLVGTIEEV